MNEGRPSSPTLTHFIPQHFKISPKLASLVKTVTRDRSGRSVATLELIITQTPRGDGLVNNTVASRATLVCHAGRLIVNDLIDVAPSPLDIDFGKQRDDLYRKKPYKSTR